MKIALVILHADCRRGGAERYTIDLARALGNAGHEAAILASSFGESLAFVEQVPLGRAKVTRTGRYVSFLDCLDEYLSRHRYDIVHAMLPVRQCDVYHPHAGVAAGSGGGWWSRRRRYAEVERGLLTGPEPPLVLCLSEYVKRDFRKHYVMDERRLVGLFNAVDLGRFDPAGFGREDGVRAELGIGGEQVMALMIAQDFARKGLREGIQALAQVNDGRLRLVVVGGDGSGPYRRLARRLGVGGQVIFVGAKADPVGYYAAADFFLLPTHHDPCSLVVLESLAMGLPVISTAQNGACEVMRDGQEGFVLPEPSDVVGLAGAIRAMLDGAARDRMRAACLALRPKLSQEEHMRQLLRAYQTARQGRGAAGGD